MRPAGCNRRRLARAATRALPLSLVLALAAPLAGCLTDIGPVPCDRSAKGNPPVRYTEGRVENGVYMTSDWDEELLYFPGGMHYELEHKLGATPRWWIAYASHDRTGADEATIAIAPGDMAQVVDATPETLTIVNGTCATFWLLVVAGTGETAPPVGAESSDGL